MRVSAVQKNNDVKFRSLQIRTNNNWRIRPSEIKLCEQRLANTKIFDVIIDSHGFAIKEKMTDVLKRIQSFSLFPQENAVSVNMIGEKMPKYKFWYNNPKEAQKNWKALSEFTEKGSNLNGYTNVALWLEKNLKNVKS